MAMQGVVQPEVMAISPMLRLRRYTGEIEQALSWYQDSETVWLVDGDQELYTSELLTEMYNWWSKEHEVYWIEYLVAGAYFPIGDVSFGREDLAIVIGHPDYRRRGIGTQVIRALISRAAALGFEAVYVEEIYDWNEGSKRCFQSLGFKAYEKTANGQRYWLKLNQ